MTDLGFPNNPALNELFTSGWSTWMFDGVKWQASVPSGGVYEPVFGGPQFPMYGFLYQKTPGDPGYSADWAGFGAHRWRFGISPGDDQAAGSIDYRGYVSDALSIVGAGPLAGSRKINLYDNVNISGNLTVGTTTILGGGGGIVSVGSISATGPLLISGQVGSTGSNAIFTFQDRTSSTNWGWYAQAGVARLWNDQSGDRFAVDSGGSITTPGNINLGGNIYVGGPYLFLSGVRAGGPFIYGDATDIAAQLGTNNGAFKWYSNPGAQLMSLTSGGLLAIPGSMTASSVSAGGISATGPNAQVLFADRTAGSAWLWYATGGSARLYSNGADRLTVDSVGNLIASNTVYAGGGTGFAIAGTQMHVYNADGTNLNIRVGPASGGASYFSFYADGHVYIPGAVNAGGAITAGGNIAAPNFLIGGNATTDAGTVGFLNANGPGIQFWGTATGGAGEIQFVVNGGAVGQLTPGGNLNLNGGVTTAGQFLKRGGGPSYRISPQADNTGIGSMWYTDPSNFYLLLTANNDAWGAWNGLRPFMVTLGNGYVTLGHRVDVNGGLYANAGIMVTGGFTSQGGSTFNAAISVNGGSDFNGYVNINNGNNLGVSGNVTAYGGQIVCYNSNLNGFYVQNANGHYLRMYDDTQGHIEVSSGTLYINYTTGSGTYFGGTIDVSGANFRGDFSCQGTIYCNAIVMNNTSRLFGRDTAGTPQWLITIWNDNSVYISDNSRDVHVRGATTYIDGPFRVSTTDNARVVAPNGQHARWWYEVSGTRLWSSGCVAWGNWYHADESRGAVVYEIDTNGRFIFYSDVSIPNNAYLWFRDTNGSVRYGLILANDNQYYLSDGNLNLIVRAPNIYLQGFVQGNGNIQAAGSLGANGIWFGNNGGWWWTGSPIHTDSNIQCARLDCSDFYVGGCRFYNNGGWSYFDQSLQANDLYSRNSIWNAGNITAGNDCTANGVFRGSGNGGARIGNWQGSGWDWMAFAIISGGYLGVSPDQGASGFNYTPNGNWSDARLKLNIRPSEIDALALISAIPVRAFEWTEEGGKLMPRGGSPVSCGLVAQELEELIPSAVTLVPVIGDLAGEGVRCLVPEQLDAYYIRAIQQLLVRVEELEHQLEGRA